MTRRVLYVQYTNPAGYPPLQHSSRILADAGWEVFFLGSEAQGTNRLDFPPHPRIVSRTMRFCPPGWRQKLHYARFCVWTLLWALRLRPQWIYASEMLACLPALFLRALPGARLIYHEHDSPVKPQNLGLLLTLSFWARRICAQSADLCILPNQARAEQFIAATGTGGRVAVVWNCPAKDEVAPERTAGTGQEIRFLYQGSIVPDRLPLTVIEALGQAPDSVSLTIVGYETAGSIGYVDLLRERAGSLGIDGRLHYAGAMSRSDLMQICRTFDVGLSLLPMRGGVDRNLQAMVGASNKPFDYLANGLPMLVSDLPAWQKMFVEPGYAVACNPEDRDSIAAAIRRFCQDLPGMRVMGENGRRQILSEWNYERQFQPVLRRMSEAVNG